MVAVILGSSYEGPGRRCFTPAIRHSMLPLRALSPPFFFSACAWCINVVPLPQTHTHSSPLRSGPVRPPTTKHSLFHAVGTGRRQQGCISTPGKEARQFVPAAQATHTAPTHSPPQSGLLSV